MNLRLPYGYHAHHDPDVLVLERADGSVVARFSGRGVVAEEVERPLGRTLARPPRVRP